MKDVGIRIRVEPELRDQFAEACKQEHVPAAQVLREFMRHFVATKKVSPAPKGISRSAGKKITA